MSFSYTETLPTPLDRVRHMLGDVIAPGNRSDETITALLSDYPENEVTMILAESLASEFAMKPTNLSSPDGSITWGDRVEQLRALATRLRLEVDEGIVEAAQDKLRSFAPIRADLGDTSISEYRRPAIFFTQDGEFTDVEYPVSFNINVVH